MNTDRRQTGATGSKIKGAETPKASDTTLAESIWKNAEGVSLAISPLGHVFLSQLLSVQPIANQRE
ncbi:MAG: hypothetical protein AB7F83_11350 [Lysobacterales bacterium]